MMEQALLAHIEESKKLDIKIDRVLEQNKEQTKQLKGLNDIMLDANNGIVVRVTKLETKQGTIISTMIGLFTGAYTGILTVLTKLFIV